jgi:hypothetical protein
MNLLIILLLTFIVFNFIGLFQIDRFNKNSKISILNSNNKLNITDVVSSLNPLVLKNTCSIYDILNNSKLNDLLDSNKGYIVNDNGKNITFDVFNKSENISMYHNSISIKDFNIKYSLDEILKYFNSSLSCNNKHYLNIFKGVHTIDTINQKNNICIYSLLEGKVTFYLINPKYHDNITNNQYKKWANKIVLNEGEILSIPPNWKYNYECNETVVMSLSTSDKYNTYLYNLLK